MVIIRGPPRQHLWGTDNKQAWNVGGPDANGGGVFGGWGGGGGGQ